MILDNNNRTEGNKTTATPIDFKQTVKAGDFHCMKEGEMFFFFFFVPLENDSSDQANKRLD